MLNKLHSLSIYNTKTGKNKKKCLIYFDPDGRVFVLSNCHMIQLCVKFSSVIFIYLTPFSELFFGLLGLDC